jgi:hypothetical protein
VYSIISLLSQQHTHPQPSMSLFPPAACREHPVAQIRLLVQYRQRRRPQCCGGLRVPPGWTRLQCALPAYARIQGLLPAWVSSGRVGCRVCSWACWQVQQGPTGGCCNASMWCLYTSYTADAISTHTVCGVSSAGSVMPLHMCCPHRVGQLTSQHSKTLNDALHTPYAPDAWHAGPQCILPWSCRSSQGLH